MCKYLINSILQNSYITAEWPTQVQSIFCIHKYIFKFELQMLFNRGVFEKKITQYESTHQRINVMLSSIKMFIHESLGNNISFSACYTCLQKYLQRASEKYRKQDYFPMIKLNMLMHSLLLEEQPIIFQKPERSQKMLQLISQILNKMYSTQSSALKGANERRNNYLKTVIHNYVIYLQKKTRSLQQALQQFLQQDLRDENYPQNIHTCSKNAKCEQNQKQTIQPWMQLERHYQKCYININLLNSCAKIADKLQGIIRYYGDKYKFITDLNIILAAELGPEYQKLRSQFMGIKTIQSLAQLQSSQYFQLIKQIQTLNEKLYMIFLNRYNYFFLSKYTPTWIEQAYKSGIKVSCSMTNISIKPDVNIKKPRLCSVQIQTSTNHDTSIDQNMNSRQNTLSDIEVPLQLGPSCSDSPVAIRSSKQIEMITLLEDLTLTFKKSLSHDEEIKICKTSRVKKSKSFYESKDWMKTLRI